MSHKNNKYLLPGWGLILGAAIGGGLFIMTGQVLYFVGAGLGLVFGAMAQSYLAKKEVTE